MEKDDFVGGNEPRSEKADGPASDAQGCRTITGTMAGRFDGVPGDTRPETLDKKRGFHSGTDATEGERPAASVISTCIEGVMSGVSQTSERVVGPSLVQTGGFRQRRMQFGAGANIELSIRAGEIRFDGSSAHEQARANLRVRQAL